MPIIGNHKRSQQFAGSLFAFDVHETKMRSGTPHALEEVLHDRAAADHRTEHPALRLNHQGLQCFDIQRDRCRVFLIGWGGDNRCQIHNAFRPAEEHIGGNAKRMNEGSRPAAPE